MSPEEMVELVMEGVQLALDEREQYTKSFIKSVLNEWWAERSIEETQTMYQEVEKQSRTLLDEVAKELDREITTQITKKLDDRLKEDSYKKMKQSDYLTHVDDLDIKKCYKQMKENISKLRK
jgi:hypothetical protein